MSEEKNKDKFNTVNIIVHINEVMSQTEIIQFFRNDSKSPIELSIKLPELSNCTITKFEMILNNQKVTSKILEKEKAKEKYNDSITTGNYSFVSFNDDKETTICLGNVPSNKEIELKSFYFGNLICNDLSYQSSFPVIFPQFIIEDPKNKEVPNYYNRYAKKFVKGKIYLNTFSKITRLIIQGSSNFNKIEKKYGNDFKSAEIEIYKDNFSEKDIPGIILFRTEKMNEDIIYNQYDSKKELNYFLLQKTYKIPELNLEIKNDNNIEEEEKVKYISLIKNQEKKENQIGCYIFLIDQSGSMRGDRIELCSKSLLLFLQSLNKGCFFQLIGFGSKFEYFSKEPLEYNKENVQNLMNIIKKLNADKGGTDLYKPLKDIFENQIYDKFIMHKHIFLLTDGEIEDKETTLNLIGSNSDKFTLHSLGIGNCDLDLIKRSAIMGNGNSYFIDNLQKLNKNVIDALEKAQSSNKIICNFENNQKDKTYIEYNQKQVTGLNNFMRYGFILKERNIKDITISINVNDVDKNEDIKLTFNKDNIKLLPDGDKIGKIIVDNYLKCNKSIEENEKIKLSKDFNILASNTAFYAEIQNEEAITEKIVTYTNKDIKAINNESQDNNNIIIKENNFELNDFGYDEEIGQNQQKIEKKKNYFCNLFSNLFSKKNQIIKKKKYKYKSPKKINSKLNSFHTYNKKKSFNACHPKSIKCKSKNCRKKLDSAPFYDIKNENDESKKLLNFDELILSQDIFDGNWQNNEEVKLLIEEENEVYEKIKKISEEKGIKEENAFITLLVLYYIFKKNSSKVDELKFVINKAKGFIKKIYSLEYEEISKEI